MFGKKTAATSEEKKEDAKEETEMTDVKKEAGTGGSSVGEMRRGDYMIHVYLEKGKEFNGGADTVDPMVELTCLG